MRIFIQLILSHALTGWCDVSSDFYKQKNEIFNKKIQINKFQMEVWLTDRFFGFKAATYLIRSPPFNYSIPENPK